MVGMLFSLLENVSSFFGHCCLVSDEHAKKKLLWLEECRLKFALTYSASKKKGHCIERCVGEVLDQECPFRV